MSDLYRSMFLPDLLIAALDASSRSKTSEGSAESPITTNLRQLRVLYNVC